MSQSYHYGNVVRLEGSFFDFDKTKVDPQLVKIIIYSDKYEVLLTQVLTVANKKSAGVYFFDFITDSLPQSYYYEWYGEIDGTPSLNRGQFSTKFI